MHERSATESNERMLTRRELAERLKVSLDTVDRETAKGKFRVHRIGKDPRYLWSEIVKDTEERPLQVHEALRRIR